MCLACVFYARQPFCTLDQSRHMRINETIRGKTEDSKAFSEVTINRTSQSHVLVVHALTSPLYMLKRDQRKAPINKVSRSGTPKTQQIDDFMDPSKSVISLVATKWDGTCVEKFPCKSFVSVKLSKKVVIGSFHIPFLLAETPVK